MNMLSGRVLITGASSGIGKALALEYLKSGWQVVACGRDKARLDAILEAHPRFACQLSTLTFNVSDRLACLEAASSLDGELDLIILNAGSCEYIDNPKVFDGKLFARVIETNLISVGFCLEAFLPALAAKGRLALMGSSAALLPLPRAEAYGASKAALAYLASTLRLHLAPDDIGVSLIEPGFVRTPLTDKNDFPMPGRIEVEDAARRIVHGLSRGKDRIQFPRRLLWPMRLLALLPGAVWGLIAKSNIRRQSA
ncbi:SDR family NAD(P)-dependent oxidoreductase [Shewanella litorisediminis]|uniref:SDR family NAD(P)-dependent oxidoreductase n=1 Tax=Shewanella litorisediminis TaxID=1173586 RepID=A0ABX7G5M9_9GAMM|nr:SDR family NAD(P)-dependent oxidoreductase [Shewanella litorisediminis]MCL2917430.1 SDR family NAD(P)-dependent oxidoreductase [Shewanella litorisediminis]QRH02562.1 SDR family NAD(P)-dependent oxidoreductase [Shewanella litorisediminis]